MRSPQWPARTSSFEEACAYSQSGCKIAGFVNPFHGDRRMYQTPKLEKFGSFRELTLSGGTPAPGDVSPYHRYGG